MHLLNVSLRFIYEVKIFSGDFFLIFGGAIWGDYVP